ncbi:MAG: DUF72 domain-containing protein [Gemmataceae bacterium]
MYVWVGTSGYSYPNWVGDFYPEGTRPEKMLPFYCGQFPLVELNFTFYRPPTRAQLVRLADKTPAGFQFVVKLPQTISHDHSPLDLPGFRHAVEGLAERGQLAGLLAQFPQSMHCTRAACDWVSTVSAELSHLHLAVEFRHKSWTRSGLPAWLAEKGLDLVAVDVPDLPGLFPRGWVQSTSTAYIRLHSRNADKWFRGDGERYDYDYPDDELNEWVAKLVRHDALGTTERALLLFNNCQRSQAAVNARRMIELLGTQAPQLNVIGPFAAARPVQKTLFT